jgi:hypothetical protein
MPLNFIQQQPSSAIQLSSFAAPTRLAALSADPASQRLNTGRSSCATGSRTLENRINTTPMETLWQML